VVTVNYRLGAFGYAALGDGPAAELRGCTGADPATVPVERLLDAQQQVQARHGDRRTTNGR
jgi:hypothetical protein